MATRRGFIFGMGATFAIAGAGVLMPIRPLMPERLPFTFMGRSPLDVALQQGDVWFDTASDRMFLWNGRLWIWPAIARQQEGTNDD